MQIARELFLHELRDMLDAEHRILEILSEQHEESSNPSLQSAFQSHHKQTESQIERLEQCFKLIGAEAQQKECAGIKGLRAERETVIQEDPAPDILDVVSVAAAIKVERYEISSYELLIRLAEQIKQSRILRLLKRDLSEEEESLNKMTTLAAKIKPEKLDAFESKQKSSAEAYSEKSAGSKEAPEKKHQGIRIVKKRGTRRAA